MKLNVFIEESVSPKDQHVIVTFEGDRRKMRFEVFVEEPWQKKMRKFDLWNFNIKFRSVQEGTRLSTELYSEDEFPISKISKK